MVAMEIDVNFVRFNVQAPGMQYGSPHIGQVSQTKLPPRRVRFY